MKFKDYRGLEFPEFLRLLGFTDYSWHNDASARASIECMGDAAGFRWVWVWVAEDDASEREFPEAKKFTVCRGPGDKDGMDDMASEVVCETDDPAECERARLLRPHRAAWGQGNDSRDACARCSLKSYPGAACGLRDYLPGASGGLSGFAKCA